MIYELGAIELQRTLVELAMDRSRSAINIQCPYGLVQCTVWVSNLQGKDFLDLNHSPTLKSFQQANKNPSSKNTINFTIYSFTSFIRVQLVACW